MAALTRYGEFPSSCSDGRSPCGGLYGVVGTGLLWDVSTLCAGLPHVHPPQLLCSNPPTPMLYEVKPSNNNNNNNNNKQTTTTHMGVRGCCRRLRCY
jgi:hypothetical protein